MRLGRTWAQPLLPLLALLALALCGTQAKWVAVARGGGDGDGDGDGDDGGVSTTTTPDDASEVVLEEKRKVCGAVTNSSLVIQKLEIRSDIKHRYAVTKVHSNITNLSDFAEETQLVFALPERAFISSFLLDVNGTAYKAVVKSKEEAESDYKDAVSTQQSAAHISGNARGTGLYSVSVNVEPMSSLSFNLTYEELLTRQLSFYNHLVSVSPNQVVSGLNVYVNIKEENDISEIIISTPKNETFIWNTTNKIETHKTSSMTASLSKNFVKLHYHLTCEMQSTLLSLENNDNFNQLKIRYDVERNGTSSELLYGDGYFVHFFAPENLTPIPKHMIFVLDTSTSMWGRKIEQLKTAMISILDALREEDYFSLIQFGNDVNVWAPQSQDMVGLNRYNGTHAVNSMNIDRAKYYVSTMNVSGGTNINSALRKALELAAKQKYSLKDSETNKIFHQPIILFLTDGIPTTGELRSSRILAITRARNSEIKASIFTISIGDSANFGFLKRLSLQNRGFARKIYEASDTSIQLESFFEEISSPLLTNVDFEYTGNSVKKKSITRSHFYNLYKGSEIIVAGELNDEDEHVDMTNEVTAENKISEYHGNVKRRKVQSKDDLSRLERLWAFLTIQQLLDNHTAEGDYTRKEEATKLALKYGFVTPVTSLIVIKPFDDNATLVAASKPLDDLDEKSSFFFQHKVVPVGKNPLLIHSQTEYASTDTAAGMKKNTTSKFDESQNGMLPSIDQLTWLKENLDSSGYLVIPPSGSNPEPSIYKINELGTSEWPEEMLKSCRSPLNEEGICRPLPRCILSEFADNFSVFLKYFCPINEFAGVCCPQYVKNTTETHQSKN